MNISVILNLELNADSEKQAKDRIIEFMKYVMRVERSSLGLEDWEFINVSQIPNSFGCRNNNN